MSKLNDHLAAFETRAQAALAAVYDPERPPTPQRFEEIVNREAELARNYLRDIGELAEMVRKFAKQYGVVTGVLREVSMNPLSDDQRASGRTTRLILRGLIALSEGRDVFVVAATTTHARTLASEMKRQAVRMQIPMLDRRILHGTAESEHTGFRGVTLVDHHAIEEMEAK